MKKNIIEEQSINDNNYQKLKELFPHAISVDENGKYVIDPQKLQMSLDPSKAEIREDGYGLNWVGKKEAYHTAFSKNYKVLKPLKEDSKNWDDTENILIKGDNLDALKILRHNYFESIKMIYIDPPYNTKNDGFVYNDNFTSSTEQTLEELGYDREYIDYIENIQGAKTHSGWLSFMYPRLLLARDLLKDDGVIFISIDDNEVAQLRLLCDEVFGEENFVAQLIWKSRQNKDNRNKTGVSIDHEYLLCYTKNNEYRALKGSERKTEQYKNPDNDPRGVWVSANMVGLLSEDLRPNCHYDLVHPETSINYGKPKMGWRYDKKSMSKLIQEERIIWPDSESGRPRRKVFLNELSDELAGYSSIVGENIYTRNGTQEIEGLFENRFFDFPKPIKLMQDLITQVVNNNDLILDFFAGSGTTAHAVMDLNAKDGGNRKYICVQWAEATPEKSEARKAGYETIFDITRERIKRAGEKILGEAKASLPKESSLFGGTKVPLPIDVGFRTFEIVEDVKQKIYQKSLEEMTQEDLLSFTNKPSIENNEEILYNLFVAENLPLSTKYETLIEEKLFLACNVAFVLGDITSDELVEALRDKKVCEYITVYSPNISNDKLTLEIEGNISKLGIKPDKLRFRG